MNAHPLKSGDLQRMEAAANWLQRLQAEPRDETLAMEWFEWCQAAPENLAAFERMREVWQAFEVEMPQARPRARLRRFVGWRYAAAAALVIGVAVGALTYTEGLGGRTLTTDVAEHGSQTLADGSRVELGARTRIATRFTRDERTVLVERGEAFFEVAKDPSRPFTVEAGDVRIKALGTAFNVRRALNKTVVTVSEGLVSVMPVSTQWPSTEVQHELRATAGERVTFSVPDNRLSMTTVDPASADAWRQGVLKFVDEPLAAVMEEVNRYATKPIVIDGDALDGRVYTGTVYRDRIDEWLHALERVFPVKVVDSGNPEVHLVATEAASFAHN